jgi:hypothetical protein
MEDREYEYRKSEIHVSGGGIGVSASDSVVGMAVGCLTIVAVAWIVKEFKIQVLKLKKSEKTEESV